MWDLGGVLPISGFAEDTAICQCVKWRSSHSRNQRTKAKKAPVIAEP
jgi:hypothetical protein